MIESRNAERTGRARKDAKFGRAWRAELPTWLLTALIYGGWLGITATHALWHPFALLLAGGVLIAWHGSLQHETIHGHPTRTGWINSLIGAIPLSLWLPYAIYRRTHIAHHGTPDITHPHADPESHYLASDAGVRYRLGRIEASLLGRLVLGPFIRVGQFFVAEGARAFREPLAAARDWMPHLVGVVAVIVWLAHVEFSIWAYLALFVYPGVALSLLRSFAEHRAHPNFEGRAAIVRRAGPFGLLFLHNNLHAVHHARPDLAWHQLPGFYRDHAADFSRAPFYRSYGEVVRLYLLQPHDALVHPDYRRSA